MVKNMPAMQETRVDLWVGKIANGNPPVFLHGESLGQRSLVGCSPWDHKELDTAEGLSSYVHMHVGIEEV